MVLYKDKSFITNSDHPNDDWIGDADYVIDDSSDLVKKILEYYPKFKIVTETIKETDDDGNEIEKEIVTDIIKDNSYTEEELNSYKNEKISHSKQLLAQWLIDNPYLHTNGKYYSVTEEKQSLLNNNLTSYERATSAGIDYPLKWNSTGEECVEWSYSDLLALSLNIAAYVAPKVSMQQSFEVQIRTAATKDDIDKIDINYN